MTTIDSAAAGRANKRISLALAAALIATGLAGCETTSNLFANAGGSSDASSLLNQPTNAISKPQIALTSIIGAPQPVANQLTAALTTALTSRGVGVSDAAAAAQAAYKVKGYIVSAREANDTKVSYIWDVHDQTGNRVNRIKGEEIVKGAPASRDPWQAVSPTIIGAITAKTAGELAKWLPTQSSAASPAVATSPASTATAAASTAVNTANNAATTTASVANKAVSTAAATAQQVSGTTTGSIGNAAPTFNAIVPTVVGAPGDGSVALSNAIQRQLRSKGVQLASVATSNTYRIEGRVKVGAKKGGKQPIAIDWHVKDPTGKQLGTVSQKNEIPAGSLDGAWGQTADAAAAAATHGIIELLPNKQKVANR